MSRNLFDDDDDNISEDNFQIKTNESYVKQYNTLRKKELLQKCKDNGLDVSGSESENTSSSEEDEVLDPTFDQDFLKTLASLKSKDPVIYDKSTKFFRNVDDADDSSEEDENRKINKQKKSKPVTIKDYERKIILERGGKFIDDSDSDNEDKRTDRSQSPTVVEEERRLKAEFQKVINKDDSSDEEFGGIFKKREKTRAEKDKEEENYLKWLSGKQETIEKDVKEKLEPLKNYWNNEKLPSSEKFLRDYVLNKGYSEVSNYNEIPTYEEIVGDQVHLSEDEMELEKQAEFEQKYNFRYEEPDQDFIKRYPRTIENSLRLMDEKRKKKRQEIKERKVQEKQQKLKELEIVKELKRKEIQEKIEKLKLVTGNDELGFKEDDLEEDFDPEGHDRRMQELFNDDYYQMEEGEEKPECPSDIEDLKVEDWDNYDPNRNEDLVNYNEELHCEDEDFNMDCDYDPAKAKEELQKELIGNTRKRRSGRKGRRDRFMEIIKSEKPVFDPEDEKTYEEYIDEYYKLDCEDIIGDTPCRFKYVETTPNDFGLTIEEILLAKNKELNQWASLKKAIQIKPDHVEKKEIRLYKMKSKNEDLKRKIFKSLYREGSDNESEDNDLDHAREKNDSNSSPEKTLQKHLENSTRNETKNAMKRKKDEGHDANGNGDSRDSQHAIEETSLKISETNDILGVDVSSNNIQPTKQEKDLGKKKKKTKKKKKIQLESVTDSDTNLAVTKNNPKNPFCKGSFETRGIHNQGSHSNEVGRNTMVDGTPPLKANPFGKSLSKCSNFARGGVGDSSAMRNNKSMNALDNKSITKFKHKKSYKLNGNSKSKADVMDISNERLKAYGINPKKFHKKQKYGNGK